VAVLHENGLVGNRRHRLTSAWQDAVFIRSLHNRELHTAPLQGLSAERGTFIGRWNGNVDGMIRPRGRLRVDIEQAKDGIWERSTRRGSGNTRARWGVCLSG